MKMNDGFALSWRQPKTLEDAIQERISKRKFLESLDFWEVEIQEILSKDSMPFDEDWQKSMIQRKFVGVHENIDNPVKPKKRKADLPWAAIGCSGLVGIANTYADTPGTYWPAVSHVAGFFGLVLFVKWAIGLWKS
jgi:hypothetical protein